MNIYKLTPIEFELNNIKWEVSTHKEEIVVRANSEANARRLIAYATNIASEKTSSMKNTDDLLSPWNDKRVVICTIYEGSKFTNKGEEKILKPEYLYKATKKYVIRKIVKTFYELNPFREFIGDEIEYLGGFYNTIDEAKQIIAIDKTKFGNTYKYIVAENNKGRNLSVYEE